MKWTCVVICFLHRKTESEHAPSIPHRVSGLLHVPFLCRRHPVMLSLMLHIASCLSHSDFSACSVTMGGSPVFQLILYCRRSRIGRLFPAALSSFCVWITLSFLLLFFLNHVSWHLSLELISLGDLSEMPAGSGLHWLCWWKLAVGTFQSHVAFYLQVW